MSLLVLLPPLLLYFFLLDFEAEHCLYEKCYEFLLRMKVCRLHRYYVLDATTELSLPHFGVRVQLHDKSAIRW